MGGIRNCTPLCISSPSCERSEPLPPKKKLEVGAGAGSPTHTLYQFTSMTLCASLMASEELENGAAHGRTEPGPLNATARATLSYGEGPAGASRFSGLTQVPQSLFITGRADSTKGTHHDQQAAGHHGLHDAHRTQAGTPPAGSGPDADRRGEARSSQRQETQAPAGCPLAASTGLARNRVHSPP